MTKEQSEKQIENDNDNDDDDDDDDDEDDDNDDESEENKNQIENVESWDCFHGAIDKGEAERCLLTVGRVGLFLIRASSLPGAYAFAVISKPNLVAHILCKKVNGKLQFGRSDPKDYRSIQAIIDAYSDANGTPLREKLAKNSNESNTEKN